MAQFKAGEAIVKLTQQNVQQSQPMNHDMQNMNHMNGMNHDMGDMD